ncbi:hypothetical protein A4A49_07155 [Nicotiana attenuata]|uniref:Carboxypeptidase A inhibitor-like domain-containing protein n=1 Tax=Nicotiana attenuata TaxID=49451 RepID=A0A1J6J134_NICAT|nr:hypothetical protein A4A49_07155 [Nicotiana attenuata]
MMLPKHSFVLAILIMVATTHLTILTNTTVGATQDVDLNLLGMRKRLLPQLNTCLRSCKSSLDCNDCWVCCACGFSITLGGPMCLTADY